MALLKSLLPPAPHLHHSAHIDLVKRCKHRRGMLCLHQALCDGLSPPRKPHSFLTPACHSLRHTDHLSRRRSSGHFLIVYCRGDPSRSHCLLWLSCLCIVFHKANHIVSGHTSVW